MWPYLYSILSNYILLYYTNTACYPMQPYNTFTLFYRTMWYYTFTLHHSDTMEQYLTKTWPHCMICNQYMITYYITSPRLDHTELYRRQPIQYGTLSYDVIHDQNCTTFHEIGQDLYGIWLYRTKPYCTYTIRDFTQHNCTYTTYHLTVQCLSILFLHL